MCEARKECRENESRRSELGRVWGVFFSIFPMMMSLYKHIGAIEDDEDCREKWVRVSEEWKTRKKSMEKKLVVVKYTIAIAVRRASLARSNCTLLRSMKIYGKKLEMLCEERAERSEFLWTVAKKPLQRNATLNATAEDFLSHVATTTSSVISEKCLNSYVNFFFVVSLWWSHEIW